MGPHDPGPQLLADETLISCDESGSEGENLTAASHRVFVEASVDLTLDEASSVMAEARQRWPTQADEYKAEHLLARRDAMIWLLSEGGPVQGRGVAYLVDKQYFVVGKIIDLLVEEVAHADGVDLYDGGRARGLAWALHRDGPRAFSAEDWNGLLAAFNSLMRARQRKYAKTTVEEFFALVDRLRLLSRRSTVSNVLDIVWTARPQAQAFQERLSDTAYQPPALDPLITALAQTARAWAERTGKPIRIIHDVQAVLTPPRVGVLIQNLTHPPVEFACYTTPIRVVAIEQVNSHEDPRVQVADLLAGTARHLATAALETGDTTDATMLRPFTDPNSLWSDDASWAAVSGRAGVGR